MLFSYRWLRALFPEIPSPEETAEGLTRRGLTVDALDAEGSDHVLDVDIPANRPDCLGHAGLVREILAAVGAEPAPALPLTVREDVPAWGAVRIEDAGLCARFTTGLVRGVQVRDSPSWVVERLERCGLRSVNNVVDASNLVLLETGQPVHFYDHARLPEGSPRLIVRLARDGEILETLDGVERRLDARTLVIADQDRAIGLAGIMGGASTEIRDDTRDVLVEAAWFSPLSVRRTARRLGLHTDASFRFERGVDPAAPAAAQTLAARLLSELAEGEPEPGGVLDLWPGRREPRTLAVRLPAAERLLGFRPTVERARAALAALQLRPEAGENADVLTVRVPTWRVDLEREADLIEEIARHVGYEEIPSRLPDAPSGRGPASPADRARDRMAGLGFSEAFGYSMIAEDLDAPFVRGESPAALALENPLAETLARLRRSILPGLAGAAERNVRRGRQDVRLFETGRVFLPPGGAGELARESLHLAFVWFGAGEPRHFSRPTRPVDLYDVTGLVRLVANLTDDLDFEQRPETGRSGFLPGESFSFHVDGEEVAWGGALHPSLGEAFGAPLYLAEVRLDAREQAPETRGRHRRLSRHPAVTRDLALVLGPERPYRRVLEVLREVAAPAPVEFEALDLYRGAPLPPTEYALTVRFTLRPPDRTLEDHETESYRTQLIEALRSRLDVRIRG